MVHAGIAGVNSHDRPNVLWKIRRLCEADPDTQFGLSACGDLPAEEVLRLVADASGISPDPSVRHGLVRVEPERVIERLEPLGDRLALAAERGERVLLATGHPTGLPLLYAHVGKLLVRGGAKLLRPLEGRRWEHEQHSRGMRYLDGVAMLAEGGNLIHTHSPEPMQMMLEESDPDLVFADHGYAGAAMEAGVDTVAIADVNDPALVVAEHLGRGGPVVVMDDNVEPEDYWPCLQVLASRFG